MMTLEFALGFDPRPRNVNSSGCKLTWIDSAKSKVSHGGLQIKRYKTEILIISVDLYFDQN